ncbi:MAG: penicillin-binding protein 2 [SAR324 cluster bacterium]|nr:penicillin-binding protein 2 [SAR324 cluster bacterium]
MKARPLEPEELRLFRNRSIIIGIVIAFIFSLLASRLWYLQVLNGEKYVEISRGNRIRLIPQAAPRGVVYDRNGIALADNRPAYQLQLIREDTSDIETTLRNLSTALGIPYAALLKKLEDHRFQAPFKPIILAEDLDYKKAAIIETYQEDFPGISIVIESRRFYPHNKIASHMLGYVGIRSEEQEKALPKNKWSSGRVVGQASIELIHNDTLIGTDGGKQIEVDSAGRELRILSKPVHPISGNDIYLTIDTRMQRFIHSTMKGKSGAVVVMKPKTGEILGMGSYPSFNPNLFASGISRKNWKRLINNPEHPLENKAIQGIYPPGSTFKLVTAYAGLAEKIIDENTTFFCNGYYHLKGRQTPYKCWSWKLGGHGNVDLRKAIQHSCNVFFYHVAVELGIDALHSYANQFGFGQRTEIALLNEKPGLMPSEEWKQKNLGERWYTGETPPVAIGQGFVTATPLQVINFINIIANDGKFTPPRIIMSESLPTFKSLGLTSDYLKLIREGMIAAVNDERGTARIIRSKTVTFAGKTGTAQVVGHKTTKNWDDEKKDQKEFQNHAWFVAFGPAEDPEISVVVLVEHGGGGSKAAGPIAKKILHYYMGNFDNPTHAEAHALPPKNEFAQQLHQAFH